MFVQRSESTCSIRYIPCYCLCITFSQKCYWLAMFIVCVGLNNVWFLFVSQAQAFSQFEAINLLRIKCNGHDANGLETTMDCLFRWQLKQRWISPWRLANHISPLGGNNTVWRVHGMSSLANAVMSESISKSTRSEEDGTRLRKCTDYGEIKWSRLCFVLRCTDKYGDNLPPSSGRH